MIVEDFNTPLTPMDRSSNQKINKETQVLDDTLDEMDLIDIFKTFHPNSEEYTFFSSVDFNTKYKVNIHVYMCSVVSGRMDTKQDAYICCLQEIHFRLKDTYRLKVRGWKNIFHTNGEQKTAGVAILISDKIDLKIKITRDKEGHYMMIKGSIQEEDITIVNICAISFSKGSSRPRDQNLISCISCVGRRILCHRTPWEGTSVLI